MVLREVLVGGINDFLGGESGDLEWGGVHRDGCMLMRAQEENSSQSLRYNPEGSPMADPLFWVVSLWSIVPVVGVQFILWIGQRMKKCGRQ